MAAPQETFETHRLRMVVARRDDVDAIDACVFAHPRVVSMLAHDGSTRDGRLAAAARWATLGPDGDNEGWSRFGLGLFLIYDRSGEIAAPDRPLGVIGLACEAAEHPERGGRSWVAELFYALDPAFHRRGVMSEAGAALLGRARACHLDEIYAVYWRMFNPASGGLLRKLGLRDDRLCGMREEYDDAKLAGVRRHELWRVATAPSAEAADALQIAALRLGHMVGETFLTHEAAAGDLSAALAERGDHAAASIDFEDALRLGAREPAAWRLRLGGA